MEDALFPLIFHDGKQGYHKGIIALSPATTFDLFLHEVSLRIPGLDPQHFHVEIVCSRAGAPADARQKIPIHANTNFRVVLNQHNPTADPNAHFMVMLKRPEQRQLDQQRKLINQQQQQQQQQQMHARTPQGMHRSETSQNPPLLGQGLSLRGAAFPWAGSQSLPRAQMAPHTAGPQGVGPRQPANMWGAVPQHHQAIPLAQAQHLSAMAQAAANARAQAQATHLKDGVARLGPFIFGHHYQDPRGLSAHRAAQSAALQAAHHVQQVQHGFVILPPPPPTPVPSRFTARPIGHAPAASLGPQTLAAQPSGLQTLRPQGLGLQTLRSQPLEYQTLGSQPFRSRPVGAVPIQPLIGVPMEGQVAPSGTSSMAAQQVQQSTDLPFRGMQILTHANAEQLGFGSQAGMAQAADCQRGGPAVYDASLAYTVPEISDLFMRNNFASTGAGAFSNTFWNNSSQDHVMQTFLSKKLNPFGSISSPRETKIPSAWDSYSTGNLAGTRPDM